VNIPLNEGTLMNFSKKLTSLSVVALLSFAGLTAATSPAQAAACPYPVTDQTANDHPKDSIRLISPVLDDSNSVRRYDFEGQFTLDCDWFGVGMRFNQVYVPFGQNVTLTFHAQSEPAGVALVNTPVKLRANKGYSSSNANIRVNGMKARPAPATAADGADVVANTDINGNVSFMIMSPDDCEAYGGILPKAPKSLDADTPHDVTTDPMQDCYSQLLPEITGEKTDSADFVELHYFDPTGLDDSTDSANIRLLAPTLSASNAIMGDGVVQAYAPVASKQIIAFQATKDDGSWARNAAVTVRINLGASGSNAMIAGGIVGNASRGASTTLAYSDLTKTAEDQLVLTGTTDAFGTVTFTLNNLDTSGEPMPASATAPVPVSGAKFTKIAVELTGKDNIGSDLEIHYFKPVPPITVSASASGRKISIRISNAIGKSFSVSITGLRKVTVRPTKATQTYTYTVTKGTKTVTVSADGRTLSKKFTIK